MHNKPSKNFDQIKPFLRMLEGSIDDARRRRLGGDCGPITAPPAAPAAQRNGTPLSPIKPLNGSSPIPLPGHGASLPSAGNDAIERPLRATPIKPKQTLHPSTGFRPTGS